MTRNPLEIIGITPTKTLDVDIDDKKAGAVIAKKFNLPKDWRLPTGNIAFNGDGMDRKSLPVNLESAAGSRDALGRRMDGKFIKMLATCSQQLKRQRTAPGSATLSLKCGRLQKFCSRNTP